MNSHCPEMTLYGNTNFYKFIKPKTIIKLGKSGVRLKLCSSHEFDQIVNS